MMTFLNTSTQYPGASTYATSMKSASTASAKWNVKSATTAETDAVSISAAGLSAYQQLQTVDPALESSAVSVELPTRLLSIDAMNWAYGTDFEDEFPLLKRSDVLQVQMRLELTERTVNQRIDTILKQHNVTLGTDEKFDFTVDQDGRIKLGESSLDPEKQAVLEQALNADSSLGQDMLLTKAQRDFKNRSADAYGDVNRGIILQAHARSVGDSDLYDEDSSIKSPQKFEAAFSFANGSLIHEGATAEGERVFSERMDSFESMSLLVGLDTPATDMESFTKALGELVETESTELTRLLNGAMDRAGLGDIKKKITFSTDASGNIVIEGNIRADQKKKLAGLINTDPDLAERIKTQRARMDILAEIEQASQDEPDYSDALCKNDFLRIEEEFNSRSDGFNFASDSLASAREQLLKVYLKENGVSLDELTTKADPDGGQSTLILRDSIGNEKNGAALQSLLAGVKGLEGELRNLLDLNDTQKTYGPSALPMPENNAIGASDDDAAATQPLLSLKRGVLSSATGENPDFSEAVGELRKGVGALMQQYNEEIAANDEDLKITGYTITLDDKGRARIDVKVKGGKVEDEIRARQFMNKMFDSSSTESLGTAILEAHDDEHGDVLEFKHKVVIKSGADFGEYTILSPDADQAALKEIGSIGAEIGAAFNEYFNTTFGLTDSFNIHWSADGTLSVTGAGAMGPAVNKILQEISRRLASDDPMSGKGFDTELDGITEKFLELAETWDKLHDPALKDAGMTFTIDPR